MFTPDQQSTALPPMFVRLFSVPAVTALFRDPFWGGLSLVPLITVIQVCFANFVDYSIAGVRKTRETLQRHLFY